jgi:autotransporter adhesin
MFSVTSPSKNVGGENTHQSDDEEDEQMENLSQSQTTTTATATASGAARGQATDAAGSLQTKQQPNESTMPTMTIIAGMKGLCE